MNLASLRSEPRRTTAARAYGLDDVVVADTELSDVDGERGVLTVRGHAIERLASGVSFEAMAALLWGGALPSADEERALREQLGEGRLKAYQRLGELGAALALDDPMDALRASVATMSSPREDERARVAITAALPVFAGAWLRRRQGAELACPEPLAPHAADALRVIGGGAEPARQRAFETYLCTVADHGLNASTFTARVVASTGSDTVSSIVAALGALKGPLHGGAPGPVLDLLDVIGRPERARATLEGELAAGRRIMGMGHRVYRTRDPRAAVLERATLELAGALRQERLALARVVEQEAEALLAARHPGRALKANVEFFTAVLLEAVGVPRSLFTAVFAMARVVGWCAHIDEQRRSGRIVRPSSRYVGPTFVAP